MARYFHVDRRGHFLAGQPVEPFKLDLTFVPDLAQHYEQLFPDGVSAHGSKYLNMHTLTPDGSPAIEVIWEYVRRSHFPNRPSRFTSIFAWRSLEEAKAWQARTGSYTAKIFAVDASEGFVANMNLLTIATSTLRASQLAHAYWADEQGPALDEVHPACWEVLLFGEATVCEEISEIAPYRISFGQT